MLFFLHAGLMQVPGSRRSSASQSSRLEYGVKLLLSLFRRQFVEQGIERRGVARHLPEIEFLPYSLQWNHFSNLPG